VRLVVKMSERRPWPEKRRKAQAENCRRTRPSDYTTGPKTTEGKATVSQNATKSGLHSAEIKRLRKLLKRQRAYLKAIKK